MSSGKCVEPTRHHRGELAVPLDVQVVRRPLPLERMRGRTLEQRRLPPRPAGPLVAAGARRATAHGPEDRQTQRHQGHDNNLCARQARRESSPEVCPKGMMIVMPVGAGWCGGARDVLLVCLACELPLSVGRHGEVSHVSCRSVSRSSTGDRRPQLQPISGQARYHRGDVTAEPRRGDREVAAGYRQAPRLRVPSACTGSGRVKSHLSWGSTLEARSDGSQLPVLAHGISH